MNRRQMIRALTLTALGTGSCLSSSSAAEKAPVAIKILKPIQVGETLQFDNNLAITFMEMVDDSRCPDNAKCRSEGDAEVMLRIKVGGAPGKNHWLHTLTSPKKLKIPFTNPLNGTVKTYVIDIATLDPHPYAGKKFLQSDYRLRLHVAEWI